MTEGSNTIIPKHVVVQATQNCIPSDCAKRDAIITAAIVVILAVGAWYCSYYGIGGGLAPAICAGLSLIILSSLLAVLKYKASLPKISSDKRPSISQPPTPSPIESFPLSDPFISSSETPKAGLEITAHSAAAQSSSSSSSTDAAGTNGNHSDSPILISNPSSPNPSIRSGGSTTSIPGIKLTSSTGDGFVHVKGPGKHGTPPDSITPEESSPKAEAESKSASPPLLPIGQKGRSDSSPLLPKSKATAAAAASHPLPPLHPVDPQQSSEQPASPLPSLDKASAQPQPSATPSHPAQPIAPEASSAPHPVSPQQSSEPNKASPLPPIAPPVATPTASLPQNLRSDSPPPPPPPSLPELSPLPPQALPPKPTPSTTAAIPLPDASVAPNPTPAALSPQPSSIAAASPSEPRQLTLKELYEMADDLPALNKALAKQYGVPNVQALTPDQKTELVKIILKSQHPSLDILQEIHRGMNFAFFNSDEERDVIFEAVYRNPQALVFLVAHNKDVQVSIANQEGRSLLCESANWTEEALVNAILNRPWEKVNKAAFLTMLNGPDKEGDTPLDCVVLRYTKTVDNDDGSKKTRAAALGIAERLIKEGATIIKPESAEAIAASSELSKVPGIIALPGVNEALAKSAPPATLAKK